ncbi:MAG: glycerophosphodiester phosphodiesterase [Phycisphaerae bacterium]|nr:glycerophosphodiester phosphodiesterase [Phycisphaerae bacterium]
MKKTILTRTTISKCSIDNHCLRCGKWASNPGVPGITLRATLLVAVIFVVISGDLWAEGSEIEKSSVDFGPLVIAHRGASRDAPENTIAAFRLAWKQHADAIEGDFHLTKDGHIVCIHDKNTKRVARENLVVKESTLKQLRALDVGKHPGKAYKGSVIPTIAEVFSTVPEKKKIYIEVKCGAEIIEKLLSEIRKSGLKREQIALISFNKEVIRKFKTKAPDLKALLLVSFKRTKLGEIRPAQETVMKDLALCSADGLSASRQSNSKEFIKKVMTAGYEYHVWTVDDVKTANRFKELGAMSITTNVVGLMKQNFTKQNRPQLQ